jgi:hypothetical protein
MNLEPPKLPAPDNPFEKFILTLLAAANVVMLSMVFSQFPIQPLVKSLDDLFVAGLAMLVQVCIILIANYEPPGMDD